MILRIPIVIGTLVTGTALMMSGCTSSPTHPHASSTPSKSATVKPAFQAGPDPCHLVTVQDILTALKVHMAKVSGTKSTCSYADSGATRTVSITTAQTTMNGAKQMVAGTSRTVKVTVQHLSGLGDMAVAYLTVTSTLSIATCLVAKNGTFIFLNVGGPHASHLLQAAIALARTAAGRA